MFTRPWKKKPGQEYFRKNKWTSNKNAFQEKKSLFGTMQKTDLSDLRDMRQIIMLLDSFAMDGIFHGTHKGEKVRRFVEDNAQLYTSPIVIRRNIFKSLRTDGNAQERTDFIMKRCAVVVLDEKIAMKQQRYMPKIKSKLRISSCRCHRSCISQEQKHESADWRPSF